jgi:stage III sporulation protein AG
MQFPKIPKIPEKAVPLIILLVVVAAVLLFGNSAQTDDEPKGNNLAVSGTGLGNQPSSGDAVVEALSGYDAEADAAMDAEERVLEKKVKDAVEKMAGVGKVHVTITFETGVMREYERDINYVERQTQETDSQGGTRTTTESSGSETVVVADSKPLLTQMQRAQIAGVLVVVEGGQDSQVLTRVRDAVRTLLGIDGAKVSVSAMG